MDGNGNLRRLVARLPGAPGCRVAALEEAVRQGAGSLRPGAVRLQADLDAYLAAEARLFLAAVRDGGCVDLFRPACAGRLEAAWLIHRIHGADGPGWGISARGLAFLAAPASAAVPTWRGVLSRLPAAAMAECRYAATDLVTATAVLAFVALWWIAAALDAAAGAFRLDGSRPLR